MTLEIAYWVMAIATFSSNISSPTLVDRFDTQEACMENAKHASMMPTVVKGKVESYTKLNAYCIPVHKEGLKK